MFGIDSFFESLVSEVIVGISIFSLKKVIEYINGLKLNKKNPPVCKKGKEESIVLSSPEMKYWENIRNLTQKERQDLQFKTIPTTLNCKMAETINPLNCGFLNSEKRNKNAVVIIRNGVT